jgi:hypothetical protein
MCCLISNNANESTRSVYWLYVVSYWLKSAAGSETWGTSVGRSGRTHCIGTVNVREPRPWPCGWDYFPCLLNHFLHALREQEWEFGGKVLIDVHILENGADHFCNLLAGVRSAGFGVPDWGKCVHHSSPLSLKHKYHSPYFILLPFTLHPH